EQFEEFVERTRAALSREITAAKNIVAAANAEKSSAQNAFSDLQAQCKAAQERLELTTSEFDKVAALVGVGHDIKKDRAELARVKRETEQATKALEKAAKELTEREAQVNALRNEAQRLIAIRTEGEAVMNKIMMQLNSIQIGQRL